MNSKLRVKQELQRAISTLPTDEANVALQEILKERTSNYQAATKERDELIQGVQLENLALKGALRESNSLLQKCVELMQEKAVQVPPEVALHLGLIPRKSHRTRGAVCS